ncbi:ArsR family transcriptional regulator [Amycolatopsis marina]|nr:ArsR family transcriptional regulator [Amycolatopsis marina]
MWFIRDTLLVACVRCVVLAGVRRIVAYPLTFGVVSRPAVSQHLKVLKDCGLVTDHVRGTRRMYRLRLEGVAGLRAYRDEMWTEALTAFAAAEQDGDDDE